MERTHRKRWTRVTRAVSLLAGCMLALTLFAPEATAQAVGAQQATADLKTADLHPGPGAYQTFYLSNISQQNDANDLQTDLRNMLPNARLFYMPSQNAISMRGTADDFQLAQKIIADLDRSKKTYRLTYTITEMDNGKRVGTQRYVLIAVSGAKTALRQGNRVPIVTGGADGANTASNSQVQYVDVGLGIEASLDGYSDGLKLHTKVEQSGVSDEKSGVGAQDPIVRETTLEVVSNLVPGKPLVIGSLDMPGSTRHQEIEVASELVR